MVDYKEMYLKMVRATEKAQRILIEVQQECEEMYLSAQEAEDSDTAPSTPPGASFGSAVRETD